MNLKKQLGKLASERNTPCVTISLNTHRTHPDNVQDIIELKNLLKEAKERIVDEFDKGTASSLSEQISKIEGEVDFNYNLDSLHIYLSNTTQEIIKSAWSISENEVYISNSFNIRPLIKSYNRDEEYLLLILGKSNVKLYKSINDKIIDEIKNEDFPFSENAHYNAYSDKSSDSKHLDDLVREFLNKVDKAVVKVNNQLGLSCFVICTEDNYSRLMQVADKPIIYNGHANIDYNKTEATDFVKQGWKEVKKIQYNRRSDAINEVKEAVGKGIVLTDLQEIYRAAIDGQGDLLLLDETFSQAVNMTSDRAFELVVDKKKVGAIDDITSIIVWNVFSKNGRVIFTEQNKISDLGKIVLKTRY